MRKERKFLHKNHRVVLLSVVLLCFFGVFVQMLISYINKFDTELEQNNQDRLSEVASYVSTYISRVFTDTQESMKSIANAVAWMEDGDTRMEYLKQTQKQYDFSYIGCAGKDGELYATDPSECMNVSGEDYFINAMRGQSTVSGLTRKIFKDRAASGIILAIPIGSDEHDPKGVLVAMLDISKLNSALSFESFAGDGYSYIIDKNGNIILRTKSLDFTNLFTAWKTAEYEKGYSFEKFYNNVVCGLPGILRYTYLDVKKYAYYSAMPLNDWTIVNIVSEKEVSGVADRLTRELTLIAVAIAVSFFGLMYVSMHSYGVSQESKQATNEKSLFLANMSHEIRTPMNAIVGMSEILLREDLTYDQKEKVWNILNCGKGLLTIINDILDLSKIEAGKFTIVNENYELESILYDLTLIAAVRMEQKPVKFFVNVAPDLPNSLEGDMGRVKQILLNVISNAIKFTEEGSVCLSVDGSKEGETWILRIEVTDTGSGIPKEELKDLFENFNQADIQRNRHKEGTGLGLTISKHLCEMMGGTISVTSEYGKGSSFVITIRQKAGSNEYEKVTLNKEYFLLLYEPSAILREYESFCLKRLGVRYEMSETQEDFIEAMRSGKRDQYTHVISYRQYLNPLEEMDGKRHIDQVILYPLEEHSNPHSEGCNIFVPLFPIQLPYALNQMMVSHHSPQIMAIKTEKIEPMPYVKILIVDDNLVNIQVAEGLMKPYQMLIDHALSGEEAVLAVQRMGYDLVLMDHMMPGMSGVEALEAIRALQGESYKKLPVVALTANAVGDAHRVFLQKGFDDFLAKPIETGRLNRILCKYLKEVNAVRAGLTRKEVNFDKALSQLENQEVYRKLLETYQETAKAKLPALQEWLENDRKRYIIEIHGLKSASVAIGALSLGELAAEIEKQGEEEPLDSAGSALSEFLQRMNIVLHEIAEYLGQPESDLPDSLPMIEENTAGEMENSAVNGRHIVVVDDNPVNLQLAESVLSNEFHLTKLASGQQLLQFLEHEIPDMILLDIQMPDMDGYETLRQIKADLKWKDIPVVFLTGKHDIQSEREGFRLGAKDFIRKPFDNVVMLSRVRSQLELYQYQTDLKAIILDKSVEVENLQHVITVSWAEIIESRDGTTGSHVRHTTRYYKVLLELLWEIPSYQNRLPKESKMDLLRASSLHDIGKIGISDLVLKKPAALTKDEFDDMKRHAKIGADMIQKIIDNTKPDPFLLYARDMAYYHHERWDGTGYPNGLKGNDIPFYVQVLTIADVFDALTAVRPYKKAFTFSEALDIMKKDRGTFYSPELFDIFIEHQGEMEEALIRKEEDLPSFL